MKQSSYDIHKTVMPPLAFVACDDGGALFCAQTPDWVFRFFKDRIRIQFSQKEEGTNAAMELVFCGAKQNAAVQGEGERQGRLNFVLGGQAKNWCPDLAVYERLKYRGIWEGVDLTLYGEAFGLKFLWTLERAELLPGIALRWEGVRKTAIGEDGSLLVSHDRGILADTAPVAWQMEGEEKHSVRCAYRLQGGTAFGFEILGEADPALPLIIDPVIPLKTF